MAGQGGEDPVRCWWTAPDPRGGDAALGVACRPPRPRGPAARLGVWAGRAAGLPAHGRHATPTSVGGGRRGLSPVGRRTPGRAPSRALSGERAGGAACRSTSPQAEIPMTQSRFDELPFTRPALCHCLDALSGRRTAHTSPESAPAPHSRRLGRPVRRARVTSLPFSCARAIRWFSRLSPIGVPGQPTSTPRGGVHRMSTKATDADARAGVFIADERAQPTGLVRLSPSRERVARRGSADQG
jgi:hypothetical protein